MGDPEALSHQKPGVFCGQADAFAGNLFAAFGPLQLLAVSSGAEAERYGGGAPLVCGLWADSLGDGDFLGDFVPYAVLLVS